MKRTKSKVLKHATAAAAEGIFMIIVGIALVIIGYYVFRSPTKSSPPATGSATSTSNSETPNSPYAVLSPAVVAPKVAECNQSLTYQSNGDSGPITCSNGNLNVLEWNALSALEPTIMTLGYGPSLSQVESALCQDASDSDSDANTTSSNAIEATTYQITALYYGWHFSTDPTTVLGSSSC